MTAPDWDANGDARDEWDAVTGAGVRRIGKFVFKGTESWGRPSEVVDGYSTYLLTDFFKVAGSAFLCNCFMTESVVGYNTNLKNRAISWLDGVQLMFQVENRIADSQNQTSVEQWKSFLATKYAEGDPVVIYYNTGTPANFSADAAEVLTLPDGHAQTIASGTGVAEDVEIEYLVDIEKRYVPKFEYQKLEERVAALETAAIGG